MRQASRALAGVLAAGALAGGSVAFADDGPGNGGDRGERRAQQSAFGATKLFTLDRATDADGNPEGVAFDRRSGFYFVSRVATGAISRGTLDGDTVGAFIPGIAPAGDAPLATGLQVRRGRLYVAGATTGTIRVYDLNGTLLRTIATRPPGDTNPTFINDLDVTSDGDIFATDSFRPVIYRVDGDTGAVTTIDVSAKIPLAPANPDGSPSFNLNGIVAKGDDELIVVQTATSKLFRIDLDDDDAPDIDEITLRGGSIRGGDGLLFDRGRLIVVQGSNPAVEGGANGVLTFIKLRRHRTRGEVVATRTDPTLAGPSTAARARDRYLVVNANFAGDGPPFTVSGLDRGRGGRGSRDRGARDDDGRRGGRDR